MPSLRHVGILVKNLKRATETYKILGFRPLGPVENLKVQKMEDQNGKVIELFEPGVYRPHIAVNWVEDQDGLLAELVKE